MTNPLGVDLNDHFTRELARRDLELGKAREELAAMTIARDQACSMLDDAVQLRDDAEQWFPRIAALRAVGKETK